MLSENVLRDSSLWVQIKFLMPISDIQLEQVCELNQGFAICGWEKNRT